ncbi:hypothetical protein MBLNU459_g0495t1 [Dothideomycetes sp. NU459]
MSSPDDNEGAARDHANSPNEPVEKPSADDYISVSVKNQNGDELRFHLKSDTALGKLMDAFTKNAGRRSDTLRFFIDGHRVLPTDSPAKLEMTDKDEIYAMEPQIGGAEDYTHVIRTEPLPSYEQSAEVKGEGDEQQPTGQGQEQTNAHDSTTAEPAGQDNPSAPNKINVIVKDQQNSEFAFKIKPSTNLMKLMLAFAQVKGTALGGLRFLFDGRRITDGDTPLSFNMAYNDQIEVFTETFGGGDDRLRDHNGRKDWIEVIVDLEDPSKIYSPCPDYPAQGPKMEGFCPMSMLQMACIHHKAHDIDEIFSPHLGHELAHYWP